MINSHHSKRHVPPVGPTELQAQFSEIRARTLDLTASLSAEDQMVQSMPDASPTKWHLGHTTWFFETFVLGRENIDFDQFDDRFGYIFNSYYETLGPRQPRPQRGLLSRPSLERVHDYRAHIDAAVSNAILNESKEHWYKLLPLIELGIHHEQQHQELILMDIKHAFFSNPLLPAYCSAPPGIPKTLPALEWMPFPGGFCEIGAQANSFVFDNEGPAHRYWLEPYRIASRLITNGEYLDFISDGGYARPELWLSDGWAVRQAQSWSTPLYWGHDCSHPILFTLSGLHELDLTEPVCHVSFYEADAFARWAGKRLPTEQEWEIAAIPSRVEPNQLSDLRRHSTGPNRPSLSQMFGACWQWTSSPYVPYPRFRQAAGAVGEYNGKFMSNQMVLRGSSAATSSGHSRTTYRNFFPPSARWAFSGIRLADDNV